MPDAQNSNPTNTVAAPPTDADATAAGTNRPTNSEFSLGAPAAPGELGTLGPYRIVKELGKGGMGAVYLAVDTRLDRELALKVMLPAFAADPASKERFLREAKAVAKVSHDHVVTIFEADERDGVPYIAMQFLQGTPLDEYLKKKGSPPLAHCVRIVREAALGLAAAHARGLVHRDIKPANLWLEAPNGRVKVLDFGLAKPIGADTELTKTGAVVGTPAYMSPEQARGQKVDHRTDIFSLGAVLYRLLTGRNPFLGDHIMAVLTALAVEEPTPVRELNPNVPAALADFVNQLLAKKPEARPQSAAEVAERLRTILSQPAAVANASASVPVLVQPLPLPVQVSAAESAFANLTEEDEEDERTERDAEPVREPAPKRGKGLLIACGALALVAVVGVAIALGTGGKKPDDVAKNDPPPVPQQGKKDKEKPPPVAPKVEPAPNGTQTLLTPSSDAAGSFWGPTEWSKLWVAHGAQDWKLQDGKLMNGNANRGWIGTKAEYTDFEIELEYKFGAKGNSGIFLRAWAEGDISGSQFIEVQLIDDAGYKVSGLTGTGAVFKRVPPNPVPETKLNEWNRATVRVAGKRVTVTINGTKCADSDIEFPRAKGVIGLQQLDSPVEFRNVRVRDLSDPHRAAAEWVLSVAGTVKANDVLVKSRDDLPAGEFRLTEVSLEYNMRGTTEGIAVVRRCTELRSLNLKQSGATDDWLDAFVGCTELEKLHLTENPKITDAGLLRLKECARLWELSVANTQVTGAGLGQMKCVPELRALFAGYSKVRGADLTVLSRAPNLELLDARGLALSDDDLLTVANLRAVRTLYLKDNPLTDTGLARLAALSNLVMVELQGTKVTAAGVQKLARALPKCKIEWDGGVTEPTAKAGDDRAAAEWALGVGGNLAANTATGQQVVKDAANLPAGAFQIATLDLSNLGRKVADADLARLRGLSVLSNLYLHGAPGLTDEGLAHLADLPALEVLVIGTTKVTGTGLVHTKNLLQLQMYGTPVTEDGLKCVAQLTKLTSLNLNITKVTDAQLTHLKGLTDLGVLDLSDTPITDAGLEHLTGLTKLAFLRVQNTKVTEAGAKKLAAALPRCEITWAGGKIERKK